MARAGPVALGASVAMLAVACSGTAEDATTGPQLDASAVVELNEVATDLIEAHGTWPETVDGRRMFVLHDAIYQTWALFDVDARAGAAVEDANAALAASFAEPDVDRAVAAAGVTVLDALFADTDAAADELAAHRTELGMADLVPGIDDEAQLGARVARAVLDAYVDDGSGQRFLYRRPVADPNEVVEDPGSAPDPTSWQPLVVPTGTVVDVDGVPIVDPAVAESRHAQSFDTAHWGDVTPFALESGERLRPDAVARPIDREPGPYLDELISLAGAAAGLDDAGRARVAHWTSESITARWNALARDIIVDRTMSGADAVTLLHGLNAAIHDTLIATWDAKAAHVGPRPVTEVRRLLVEGETFDAAGEPVPVEAWVPYQDPTVVTPASPGVVAEHVAVAAAAATVIELHTESGALDATVTVPAATDPATIGPASETILEWSTLDEVRASVRRAVLDGGLALAAETDAATVLGEQVGAEVYRHALALWLGAES